jgi:excinuclease UvrABC nuclease subunit
MGRKTVTLNQQGIEKLPKDKPVVYRIQTEGGRTNYVGVAKRGRVQERLEEHLPGAKDAVPGAKVQIEQMRNLAEAREREARVISRSKPRYNERGK